MADETNGTTGFVYLARCRGFYKIGWTEGNPADRVRQLQTGCPFPIELVGTIPATPAADTQWRTVIFKDKHERGDWFKLTLQDVQRVLRNDFAEGKWMNHREASMEGQRLAREQGRKPGGRARLAAPEAAELRHLREAGSSPRELMAKYRISRATLYRYLQPASSEA